jgi:hypothetical protein
MRAFLLSCFLDDLTMQAVWPQTCGPPASTSWTLGLQTHITKNAWLKMKSVGWDLIQYDWCSYKRK